MAFGIKFVPITPGTHPRPPSNEPETLAEFYENSLQSLKHNNIEAYKQELIALRERDMAITKPTQPEYFARQRRPVVQVACPSYDQFGTDFNFDLNFLEDSSYLDNASYLFTSPTDTDTNFSEEQIDQIITHMYPNGLPSNFDSWDVYRTHDGDSNSLDVLPEVESDEPMFVDDESFLKSLEEFENTFGPLDTPDLEPEFMITSPSEPTPSESL